MNLKQNPKKQVTFTAISAIIISFIFSNAVFAYQPNDLYDNVWRLINIKYVDQTNNMQNWNVWRHKYDKYLTTDEDAYVAIGTMVASLDDPYTKFLDPKDFAEETSSIKGSLKGIGIQIATKEGKLMVIAPIEDSPAEKAGLLADDEILEINGVSTKGITIDKAADKIRGEEGTSVTLLVKRKDVIKPYTIVRKEIELKAVSTKIPHDIQLPDNVAYIRLSSFISKNAGKEFENILKQSNGKKGYIIDLRSNPGGLLTNAIYIANLLLPRGIIVSTVDRDGYKETQRAIGSVVTNKPLVILINKGSASASEILSGALKDNKRAVIVGEKSFGKGLVQEINRLPNNSGINITIQKYLTPSGTDINKKGIEPDIVVELSDEDIKNKDDKQLKKANEVLQELINKNTCYGK
ncbi:MAG: S41 family peptidase [Candidatus Gastranaerophilales bacterium]|nr:S41 family peptidase [Candidatus Gastranaerophilales bacterium]